MLKPCSETPGVPLFLFDEVRKLLKGCGHSFMQTLQRHSKRTFLKMLESKFRVPERTHAVIGLETDVPANRRRAHRCHGRQTTFGEAFSLTVLLNEIWELREAPHVPILTHRVVHEDFGMHTMSMFCATPSDDNRFVFNVLFGGS